MPTGIYIRTKSYRDKMRNVALKKGFGKWMKGKTPSLKAKSTQFKKGIVPPTAFQKGFTPWNKGKAGQKHSIETRKKMSLAQKKVILRGEHHWWKGGITPKNKTLRHSVDYKLWREAVFKRDDFTCIWCGQRGGKLNSDHIKPFALFPELRFAIDNGRTLCEDCHATTDTFREKIYGYKKKLEGEAKNQW